MNKTLVVGIHREELDFGLKVARTVENFIHVVRINNGLSHAKSLYRSSFYHSTAHREMYLQLHQQLKGKTNFAIDLHTGINESGRCADIHSADPRLLRNIKTGLDADALQPHSAPGEERLYRITESAGQGEEKNGLFPVSHTIIPRRIWAGHDYIYAGLEIYLGEPGAGTSADCQYAARLIRLLCLSADNINNIRVD